MITILITSTSYTWLLIITKLLLFITITIIINVIYCPTNYKLEWPGITKSKKLE